MSDVGEDYGWGEFEAYDEFAVTCKFCGQRGLTWHQYPDGRFRLLHQDGHVHRCPDYRPKKHGPTYYTWSRCQQLHNLRTGQPINHACSGVSPAVLRAEMKADAARVRALRQRRGLPPSSKEPSR